MIEISVDRAGYKHSNLTGTLSGCSYSFHAEVSAAEVSA